MSDAEFDTKLEQFTKLWYGIVPGATTMCTKCSSKPDKDGKRIPLTPIMKEADMFDVANLRETNSLFNCTSTDKDTSDKYKPGEAPKKSCFPDVEKDIQIMGANRSKSLKFRQYIREHVRQKRVALTRENCEKYWMGELQKEMRDAETF